MQAEIDLANLKRIIDVIFDHISELRITQVCVPEDDDFFWDIPLESPLDQKNPAKPDVVVGRLSDDWEFLQSMLGDKELAVSLMLIHVAPLLRYIGTKIGQ